MNGSLWTAYIPSGACKARSAVHPAFFFFIFLNSQGGIGLASAQSPFLASLAAASAPTRPRVKRVLHMESLYLNRGRSFSLLRCLVQFVDVHHFPAASGDHGPENILIKVCRDIMNRAVRECHVEVAAENAAQSQ